MDLNGNDWFLWIWMAIDGWWLVVHGWSSMAEGGWLWWRMVRMMNSDWFMVIHHGYLVGGLAGWFSNNRPAMIRAIVTVDSRIVIVAFNGWERSRMVNDGFQSFMINDGKLMVPSWLSMVHSGETRIHVLVKDHPLRSTKIFIKDHHNECHSMLYCARWHGRISFIIPTVANHWALPLSTSINNHYKLVLTSIINHYYEPLSIMFFRNPLLNLRDWSLQPVPIINHA